MEICGAFHNCTWNCAVYVCSIHAIEKDQAIQSVPLDQFLLSTRSRTNSQRHNRPPLLQSKSLRSFPHRFLLRSAPVHKQTHGLFVFFPTWISRDVREKWKCIDVGSLWLRRAGFMTAPPFKSHGYCAQFSSSSRPKSPSIVSFKIGGHCCFGKNEHVKLILYLYEINGTIFLSYISTVTCLWCWWYSHLLVISQCIPTIYALYGLSWSYFP